MRAILTYHSIDDSGSPISVGLASFLRQAEWLASGPAKVVGLTELMSLPDSAHAIALTFDDALASVGEVAAPVLAAHALPATLFVPTTHAGTSNLWHGRGDSGIPEFPVMSWKEMDHLLELGWKLESHTRSHPRLQECTDDQLQDELEGAASDLLRHTGTRPTAVAYPYGSADSRVQKAAAAVYSVACLTLLRCLAVTDDPHALPRLDAYYFRGNRLIEQWGSPVQKMYIAGRGVLRTIRARLG